MSAQGKPEQQPAVTAGIGFAHGPDGQRLLLLTLTDGETALTAEMDERLAEMFASGFLVVIELVFPK